MPRGTTRSWAEIDLGAIMHNARTLRDLAPGASLCAVVKADGYGHGQVEAARAAVAGGATILAVARVEEGEDLRKAGLEQPIWILSEPQPPKFRQAAEAQLEPAVYSVAGIAAAAAAGASLVVHLKIDTGMHRVGASESSALALAQSIIDAPGLTLGSVWTHCAVADDPADPFTHVQLDRFERVVDQLRAAGIAVPLTHAANSGATLAFPRAHRDVIRCGIALYGLPPSPALAGLADLQPALSWHSAVGFVKRLQPGDRVSYGQRTEVERACNAATIPVGYADGYRRALWDKPGRVLVGGKPRNILGVITMDQLVVDCGNDEVCVGDDVVLIGKQGSATTTADDLAGLLDTINYEITCGISPRVERQWLAGST